MRFAIIDPSAQSVTPVECDDLRDAQQLAGLSNVDHGEVMIGLAIVVYEYGLYEDPATQSYFAIHGQLFVGNAVLYAYDKYGETTDVQLIPEVVFMPNAAAVERSIELGLVRRPEIRFNDALVWQWPEVRL